VELDCQWKLEGSKAKGMVPWHSFADL